MEQVGLDPKSERKLALEVQRWPTPATGDRPGSGVRPSVLIIDEALSNLDALNQALILKLLAELQDLAVARLFAYLA